MGLVGTKELITLIKLVNISLIVIILFQGGVLSVEFATVPNDHVMVDLENILYFEILWPESLRYTFKLKPAKDFGTRFDHHHQKIELILADPEEGCQALYNNVQDAVLLSLRGGCSFLTKTEIAEKAGAIAIIIADNDETNDAHMIDMVDDGSHREVYIPSAFLRGKDGLMIRQKLSVLGTDRAVINIPVNMTGRAGAVRRPPWSLW